MSILFLKDWTHSDTGKPTACVHRTTKNMSFLRMAVLLSRMKVKNNLFHLCLYDPTLLNVDPHNLNPTNDPTGELRLRVALECKRNVWYYLREVIRIPAAGGEPVAFKLHRGNLAMAWCFVNFIDFNGTQPRQTGKASSLTAKVKVPGGWKLMGDMQVGDIVTAADGTPSRVLGVYPQGKRPTYRFTFQDGRSTVVDEEHLWKIHNKHWKKPGATRSGDWRVISTKDILDYYDKHPNSEVRLAVPVVEPEQSPHRNFYIDPYVLGLILGDGSISGGHHVEICKPDQFIFDETKRLMPSIDLRPRKYKPTQSLVDKNVVPGTCTPKLISELRRLELMGLCAWEKFIPEEYMQGSPEQRWALLQGLMDTDGTSEGKGSSNFSTTSKKMALQFQELVRSLGGICKNVERQTYYTLHGKKLPGRISYRLTPRFPEPKKMFRLPRKKERVPENYKWKDDFRLYIKDIKYVGVEETQCIMIDHPEHLYVTDDYIVTHNTICAIALSSWVTYVSGFNMTIAMLTHSDKLVQENVKRLKDMRDALPSYLVRKQGDDIDNKQGLDYKALHNKYLTYIGQKDRIAANKVGRGSTAPVLHFDELAFIPNIRITFPAIMASTNTARQNAAASGQMHSNLYTTTAGDPSTDEGAFALEILNKSMRFTEKLYDASTREEAHEIVARNSENKLVDGTFSYLQLGLTHEWFKDTIARNNVPPDEVQRDYLNNWISVAKNPIIPKETLERMGEFRKPDPLFMEVFGEYIVNWYVSPNIVRSAEFKKKPLILGMDASEMIGRDFTTFVAVDPTDMSVVMTFRCNESNTMKVALFVADILTEYPRMLFVPERKSTAITIIDTVIIVMQKQGQNPFTRIFNKIVDQNDLAEFSHVNIYDPSLCETSYRKHLGFMTTGPSRSVLYKQILQRAAHMSADRIFDPVLINELSGLQVHNGRIDHRTGAHDDMVIAWLLACYAIYEGKNLHLYGISQSEILKAIDHSTGKKVDPAHIAEQMALRKQIKEYEHLIKTSETEYLKQHFRYKLTQIAQYLDDTIVMEPVSADAVRKDFSEYGDVYKRAQEVARTKSVNISDFFTGGTSGGTNGSYF